MGRVVRRVPLDFDLAINETWPGFVRPKHLDLPPCVACEQLGVTLAYRWIESIGNLMSILAREVRDGQKMHPWLAELGNRPSNDKPGMDFVKIVEGIAGKELSWGGCASDRWAVTRGILKAAGLDEDFCLCPVCKGEGHLGTAEQVAAHEAWEETEPPTGEGWQLWQDTGAGSPISPVFPTPEGLARWMSSPAYRWGASRPLPYDTALKVVMDGSAPTMVFSVVAGEDPKQII